VKQFILNKEPDGDVVRLSGDDYRYLVRVRRLAAGEYFPALLPNGDETIVQIISIDNGVLAGKCASCARISFPVEKPSQTMPPIILFQALPKGDKMDLIVRQAAEGGVSEIVPFTSEYSIRKASKDGNKFLRWQRIIKEARQQSGSKTATTLHEPKTIDEIIDFWKKIKGERALGLLFHHISSKGLEQNSLHSYLDSVPLSVVYTIGPEGGFSDKEVSFFLENGFKPFTIGDTILRTETAAVYCAAVIRILLLEKNSWELKQQQTGKE
jgi:16S rRNA (uracil1498-N3)-methyltransferase